MFTYEDCLRFLILECAEEGRRVMNRIQFNSAPVDPIRITSKFGPRDTGIAGATTSHLGIDLGANKSLSETPVFVVKEGIINGNYWNDARGWVITITHNGFLTLYQHLKTQCPLKAGAQVKAGHRIGTMGNSSKTLVIATHLHFELHVNGMPIDPEPYLLNIVKEDLRLYYGYTNNRGY